MFPLSTKLARNYPIQGLLVFPYWAKLHAVPKGCKEFGASCISPLGSRRSCWILEYTKTFYCIGPCSDN